MTEEQIEQKAEEYATENYGIEVGTRQLFCKISFQDGADWAYHECQKEHEWHDLNENPKDLPNEGEWVEGLYTWKYKDKVHWDVYRVRWYHEIGELDEKLVRWYCADEEGTVDEPDYWRKINLPQKEIE